jgi:hypothetical protein
MHPSRAGLLLVLGATLVTAATGVHGALLADHFGVDPQVQLISNWEYSPGRYYTGYQFTTSSMNPTLHTGSTDYQVNDWFGRWSQTVIGSYTSYPGTGTYPAGEEPYDTEAYYFDDDDQNLYFAILVGFPSPTTGVYLDTRADPDIPITHGDFALDTPYVTGSQQDDWDFQYDYGVDLTDENRPASGNVTSYATNTLGSSVYRTTTGWYLGAPDNDVNPVTGDQSNANTNFDPNSAYNPAGTMTNLGSATVSWYQLNILYGGNPVQENNWNTYVIEMTIPKSLLVSMKIGDALQYHWLMGCRNDGSNSTAFITGNGDIDFPEPGSMALIATGLGPLALWIRNRRRKQQPG